MKCVYFEQSATSSAGEVQLECNKYKGYMNKLHDDSLDPGDMHEHTSPAINSFLKRHQEVSAFVASAILFLVLHVKMNIVTFPYDAGEYWALSRPSVFFDFPATTRGYFLPMLLSPAQFFSDLGSNVSLQVFRVLTSIIYAFSLAILLPSFFIRVFGGKVSFYRRMIVPVLMTALFPGVIVYPLTDLPAILLLIGGLNCLLCISSGEASFRRNFYCLLGSGFLIGAAYNTRTIYMFSALCAFIVIPLFLYKRESLKAKVWATIAFVIGLTLVSLPQAYINLKTKNTFTPVVLTSSGGKSLFALQLMWGITIQRYETVIDPSVAPTRYYIDQSGRRIVDLEAITKDKVSIREYFSLVRKYPMDFFGLYVRHFINGMDLRDGEVYITDAKTFGGYFSVLNFLVMFAAIYAIYSRTVFSKKTRSPSYNPASAEFSADGKEPVKSWWIWLGIIVIPVVAIVPGAIETRFFLPIYLLIYSSLAFRLSAYEVKCAIRSHRAMTIIAFALMFSLHATVTLSTMGTRQYTPVDMYR